MVLNDEDPLGLNDEKLFGYEGHDFNTFFGDRIIGLDENTIKNLKNLTYGDWSSAQDIAQSQIKSDQDRLMVCERFKSEGVYVPYATCQEVIYNPNLYQNMYKTPAGDILIEDAKKSSNKINTAQ
jgi:hypothetical protein